MLAFQCETHEVEKRSFNRTQLISLTAAIDRFPKPYSSSLAAYMSYGQYFLRNLMDVGSLETILNCSP